MRSWSSLFLALQLFVLIAPASLYGETLDVVDAARLSPTAHWDKARFRGLYKELDDAGFNGKWKGAMVTPLTLTRAFEPQFYLDMLSFQNVGPIGICHGDAHFDNFGFVVFGEGPKFVINDLDDAGYCPVALDMLRLLVSIRLTPADKSMVSKVAAVYADIVNPKNGAVEVPELPASMFPADLRDTKDAKEKDAELVKTHTKHDRFILDGKLSPAKSATAEEVIAAVRKGHEDMRILDVAEYAKTTGGSAALLRFWVLHENKTGAREILELKRMVQPATAVGHWKAIPKPRLEWATRTFWSGLEIHHYRTVSLKGMEFMLRSRNKPSIEWDEIPPSKRQTAYSVEAGILAKLHRPSWKGSDTSGLVTWLEESSAVVAERMTSIHEALNSK